MQHIKNIKIILLVIGILLILVVIRNSDQNVFKEEVKSAVIGSVDSNNLISINQLKQLSTNYIVINLGEKAIPDSIHIEPIIQIPIVRLLEPANRKIMDEARGEIILMSDDVPTVSKAWVILNQLGYKRLRILSIVGNPEVFKYKFQPDSTARLENDSL